jgi:carbon storage regulator CsrA
MEKGSLILTREKGEKIMIGKNAEIIITLLGINNRKQARLRFEVERSIPVFREEIYNKMKKEEEGI